MKTELDSAWESAIHNAERARKAEAEIERLQAELAECKEMLDEASGYVREDVRRMEDAWAGYITDVAIDSAVALLDRIETARKGEGGVMAELAVCEHGSLLRQCEVCEIAGELRRLRAELAEYKQDAERYRWLREKIENDDFVIARVSDWGFTSWSGDDPDRYIDAVLAAEG